MHDECRGVRRWRIGRIVLDEKPVLRRGARPACCGYAEHCNVPARFVCRPHACEFSATGMPSPHFAKAHIGKQPKRGVMNRPPSSAGRNEHSCHAEAGIVGAWTLANKSHGCC